jgi:hypothetical protein
MFWELGFLGGLGKNIRFASGLGIYFAEKYRIRRKI